MRPAVTSRTLPVFISYFRDVGGDVNVLLATHGVTAGSTELPVETLESITTAIAVATGDPQLGLRLAVGLERGTFGLFEFVLRSAPTLRHAFQRFVRYGRLLNDLAVLTFDDHGSLATLEQRVPGSRSGFGEQPNVMFVALVVRIVRELLGAPWSPRSVAFAHREPAVVDRLVEFFGCPIRFAAETCAVNIDGAVLDTPLANGDGALLSVLDEQAERTLAALPAREDGLSRVRQQIVAALNDGQPRLPEVASAMHVSRRTLQRRLARAGLTFQDLVDRVREERARAYVLDRRVSLGEIAYRLGFSEISAFTRAFKRWTGMTPSQFRAESDGTTGQTIWHPRSGEAKTSAATSSACATYTHLECEGSSL
jgi:AraC-like DNA-binding protein